MKRTIASAGLPAPSAYVILGMPFRNVPGGDRL